MAILIQYAHYRSSVLTHPTYAEVAIQYLDDGDDWSYHFLLRVNGPSPITLASMPRKVRQLGDDSAAGIDAAISILHEATCVANTLEGQLDAFIAAKGHQG